MSFSHEVKKELSKILNNDYARDFSECYGLMLFCRPFSSAEIKLKTESISVAERFISLSNVLFSPVIEKQSTLKASKDHINLHTISLILPDECKNVFTAFGHDEKDTTLRLNRGNIENDMCLSAFLRGAFLSCGSVNDPLKNYHLEFCSAYKNLSNDLCLLLSEIRECNLTPKTILRGGSYVVYLKDSEQITDLLTFMGAGSCAMDIMNAKAYKQMRNIANRRTNSELANINKTATAAARQLAAIEKIESTVGLESLPDQLYEIAILRRDNPELSLRDLGLLLNEPISRSGVNHRLLKIIEISGIESDTE
ncbi:MAG: DNA-binding protein WhiA [Ruminococcaceae bacterium]|nr:DNA-binding protein WhiA [Oscillospiraceae bacterium]